MFDENVQETVCCLRATTGTFYWRELKKYHPSQFCGFLCLLIGAGDTVVNFLMRSASTLCLNPLGSWVIFFKCLSRLSIAIWSSSADSLSGTEKLSENKFSMFVAKINVLFTVCIFRHYVEIFILRVFKVIFLHSICEARLHCDLIVIRLQILIIDVKLSWLDQVCWMEGKKFSLGFFPVKVRKIDLETANLDWSHTNCRPGIKRK